MSDDPIDILKLYAQGNAVAWNEYLRRSLRNEDVAGLTSTLRRLQMGMDRLVKQKLNTERVSVLFIRLQRSIENTLRDIHRAKNPNPLFHHDDRSLYKEHIKDKHEKQAAFERYLKKERY